jgi:hypothetical protein
VFSYASEPIYYSTNLAGHTLAPECNPGGGASCPCSADDIALVTNTAAYGTVISNVRQTNTWVNAIGYKKFVESFPNGKPIRLDQYRYCARVRLPTLPQPNTAQVQNPQTVHLMIQLWDGRNALWNANSNTLEAAVTWELNPWAGDYGHVKVYTYPTTLADTGIVIPPDTAWHQFSLTVDLVNSRYLSLNVDTQAVDLSSMSLAQVHHADWDTSVALNLTTESMACWPQADCSNIFSWSTEFQNMSFESLHQQLRWDSVAGTNYYLQYSPDLTNWTQVGGVVPGNGSNILYTGPFCDCGDYPTMFYRVKVGN